MREQARVSPLGKVSMEVPATETKILIKRQKTICILYWHLLVRLHSTASYNQKHW